MTIYYIKQDDTVWGCGDPECCGEYYEEIRESFVNCECEIPESDMTGDHLHGCNGGGPVLKWRKAKPKEIIAFEHGKRDGWQEGSDWGIEWQKSAEAKLFKTNRDLTVHELVHSGYKVIIDGTETGKAVETYYMEDK